MSDKRISELQKQTNPLPSDKLAIEREGNTEAQYIDIQQLAEIFRTIVAATNGAGLVNVSGNVLPDLTGKSTGGALLGGGTYTQPTGPNLVLTEVLNLAGWNGSAWVLVRPIPINLANYLLKTDYNFGGSFATVADANLAIKNEDVNGKNRRNGTRVDIGTPGNYVTYWWKGGFADLNLVEYIKEASPLKGKMLVVEGDSIAAGNTGPADAFVINEVQLQTGCQINNKARSGTGYVWKGNAGSNILDRIVNISGITIDFFLIPSAGTNDWYNNVPLGSFATLNDNTQFYSAVYNTFRIFREANPETPVLVATPLQRFYATENRTSVNALGYTLLNYCEVIKEIAALFAFNVIDLNAGSRITYENRTKYLSDGLHPNELGGKLIGNELVFAVNNILKGAVLAGNKSSGQSQKDSGGILPPGSKYEMGVKTPALGTAASDRAYFFTSPVRYTSLLSKVFIPAIKDGQVYIKHFRPTADGATLKYLGEFERTLKAGLNEIAIESDIVHQVGDIFSVYSLGTLTFDNGTPWTGYRSASTIKNVTTDVAISSIPYSEGPNFQIRFEFKPAVLSSSDLKTPAMIDYFARGVLSGVNFNPDNVGGYTSYPKGIIVSATGLIGSTDRSDRRFSGFNDISNTDTIRFEGFTLAFEYCFYTADKTPILPVRVVENNKDIPKPEGAKYFAVGLYSGQATPMDYRKIFYGYRTVNTGAKAVDLESVTQRVSALENAGAEPMAITSSLKINVNDFAAGTQRERIQAALDFTGGEIGGTIVLGPDTVTGTNVWMLDKSLELSSNTRFEIGPTKIKMQDGVFDNIFRSAGAVIDPQKPFGGVLSIAKNVNIKIVGDGKAYSFVEGADVAYKAPRPGSADTTPVEWVGDNYGWRTLSVNIANTTGLEIGGFMLSKTKGWGILLNYHVYDFYVHDLKIVSGTVNGDGVDVTQYCAYGRVERIEGDCKDDTVFVGSLSRNNRSYPYDQYIYPGEMAHTLLQSMPPGSCHDVSIDDITGTSATNMVRVLATNRGKVYNISVSRVKQTLTTRKPPYIVRIHTAYSDVDAIMGDMRSIRVNDVYSLTATKTIEVDIPISDLQINKSITQSGGIPITYGAKYLAGEKVKITNIA
jgi:hypothetical protein